MESFTKLLRLLAVDLGQFDTHHIGKAPVGQAGHDLVPHWLEATTVLAPGCRKIEEPYYILSFGQLKTVGVDRLPMEDLLLKARLVEKQRVALY